MKKVQKLFGINDKSEDRVWCRCMIIEGFYLETKSRLNIKKARRVAKSKDY